MQEAEKKVQNPQKAADAKESDLKRQGWGKELAKQFWDLANIRRGRALYAALFTEFDVIPIYAALRIGETSAQGGSSAIQPILDAGMSAGAGTSSAIQSTLNSISPNAGTNAINSIHNFIQWLGGPVQASTYATMILAIAADYALYFVGVTAFAVGVKKYFQKRNQNAAWQKAERG